MASLKIKNTADELSLAVDLLGTLSAHPKAP